jgi:hypothetical protein
MQCKHSVIITSSISRTKREVSEAVGATKGTVVGSKISHKEVNTCKELINSSISNRIRITTTTEEIKTTPIAVGTNREAAEGTGAEEAEVISSE